VKLGRYALFLAVVVALSSLLIVGCGKDSTRPTENGTPAQENPDLDEPLGGYTTQDEQPSFGDADLAASSDLEIPTQDWIGTDPEVLRWQVSDSVRVYAVTFLWGAMNSDPSIRTGGESEGAAILDWSGSAKTTNGALIVRATIGFERDDYLVGPRSVREKLMWVSHTDGDFDGLRLTVLQPVAAGGDGSADSLIIETGPYQVVLPVNALASLDQTAVVDDLGNKFTIRSFQVVPQLSNRGFLGGAWLAPAQPGAFGRFQGRWVALDGSVAGTLRGIWGTNRQGERVFFGKYVDRAGTFRGILRGTWEDRGPESPSQSNRLRTHGTFRGDWVDAHGIVIGTLNGHWRAARDGADGFFEGMWKEDPTIGS
jgi:hypothetical protein